MKGQDAYEAWINARKNVSPDNTLADRVMAKIEGQQEPERTLRIARLSRIAVAAMIVGALGLQIVRIGFMAVCILGATDKGF